ncbi:hypothetical protein AXX16_4548 [Serratia rubidaea]|nr:hypothetical protein AXX16_4548 [Serratia rubidaea]
MAIVLKDEGNAALSAAATSRGASRAGERPGENQMKIQRTSGGKLY